MIPLCEPASAQKTGLEHNVWYLVVQGGAPLLADSAVMYHSGDYRDREVRDGNYNIFLHVLRTAQYLIIENVENERNVENRTWAMNGEWG